MNKTKSHTRSKKTTPMVSVIVPVFNGASYLLEAVKSIHKSTYKNFEVLLIDDGSTDQSDMVCQALDKRYKKVRYYKFPRNGGLPRVLNFALKKARGKYICRLNQDDIMLPHRIETQVKFMESRPELVASGSWINLFENDGKRQVVKYRKTDHEIRAVWHVISPFADPSVIYKRKEALKVGGYFRDMWPADDTHLWKRLAQVGKLANIQKPLVDVRWHRGAASVKYWKILAQSTYRMHRWVDAHIDPAPWYVHVFWKVQYASGMVFSPQFNWGVYRVVKRSVGVYDTLRGRTRRKLNALKKTVANVSIQPSKLSFSGS